MSYLVAALALAAACVAWYALQRWAGTPDSSLWRDPRSDCESCSRRDPGSESCAAGAGPPTSKGCPLDGTDRAREPARGDRASPQAPDG